MCLTTPCYYSCYQSQQPPTYAERFLPSPPSYPGEVSKLNTGTDYHPFNTNVLSPIKFRLVPLTSPRLKWYYLMTAKASSHQWDTINTQQADLKILVTAALFPLPLPEVLQQILSNAPVPGNRDAALVLMTGKIPEDSRSPHHTPV